MKKYLILLIVTLSILTYGCEDKNDYLVNIHTSMGTIKVLLYNETPLHKKNFLEHVKAGRYDSTEWHRIMKGFMVQGGNINTKEGTTESKSDRIPAEIVKGFKHSKGALAAARQPDQVNPDKMSSSCQFYIVHGRMFSEVELTTDQYALNQGLSELLAKPEYDTLRNKFIELSRNGNNNEMNLLALNYIDLVERETGLKVKKDIDSESLKLYSTVGGAPHLDNEYTIFGRVVEGLDVVDKLASVQTGQGDKPVETIYMTMEIVPMAKKNITEKYGYAYPDSTE